MYSETPLIRTLMGLENSVLNRGVSLLEGFILSEIKALVTDSTVKTVKTKTTVETKQCHLGVGQNTSFL